MNHAITTRLPRPRTLIHPGALQPERIRSRSAARGRHFHIAIQPGSSLYEGLVGPLGAMGIRSASFTILGGWLSDLCYCVAPPDPSRRAVIAYTRPNNAGRAYMIFGNATLGLSTSGRPLLHCHAAMQVENEGLRGGHLLTEACIVERQPISALVTALDGIELRQSFDSETNIPLLQPQEEML